MRNLGFLAATLVGVSLQPHRVAGFVPHQHQQRSLLLRPLAGSSEVEGGVHSSSKSERYIAKIHQFQALANEMYGRQHEELRKIASGLHDMVDRMETKEAAAAAAGHHQAPLNDVSTQPNNSVDQTSYLASLSPSQPPSTPEMYASPMNGYHQETNGISAPESVYDVEPMYEANGSAQGMMDSQYAAANGVSSDIYPHINGEAAEEAAIPSTSLSLAGTTFQLEELEDRDSCTTEITLEPDHTVTVGMTDGPLFCEASGTWLSLPNQLDMVITRHYEAGQPSQQWTDVGEFTFAVERSYIGSVTKVGDRLAIAGTVHNVDQALGDEEVGYFNMIDNREEDLDGDDNILESQFGKRVAVM